MRKTNGETALPVKSKFHKGQEENYQQVLLSLRKQKDISIFALHPCVDMFILPQGCEKMQHYKVISCDVTNLLWKKQYFVVVLQLVYKILWCCKLAEKAFMSFHVLFKSVLYLLFFMSVFFFFFIFPLIFFFLRNVLYLSKRNSF